MLVHWYRIQGDKSPLAMFDHAFVLGIVSYVHILRNNTQNMKLVWPVSHAHALSFFLFSSLWTNHQITVLFIKNKKETAARGETKAAGGRRVTGVSEVGKHDRGCRFHRQISQFWSAIFTLKMVNFSAIFE